MALDKSFYEYDLETCVFPPIRRH